MAQGPGTLLLACGEMFPLTLIKQTLNTHHHSVYTLYVYEPYIVRSLHLAGEIFVSCSPSSPIDIID